MSFTLIAGMTSIGAFSSGSVVPMLAYHRYSHRVPRRGQFCLRSVTDLCSQSPNTNCHRQQSFCRDDEYLLRISRQTCHRPNTLAYSNGGGSRSGLWSATWRANPQPLSISILRSIYSGMVGLIAVRIWLSILEFEP
jgi:hypothetical protein